MIMSMNRRLFLFSALVLLATGLILPFSHGWSALSSKLVKNRSDTRLFASHHEANFNRRAFLTSAAGTMGLFSVSPVQAASSQDKILVLGGTGLIGSEICRQLKSKGIDVIATSRDGRVGTLALDVTSPNINVASEVEKLAKGRTAVISTIGAIGTHSDSTVNAASGLAAAGAKAAGVRHFTYISVAPEVREFAKDIDFLKDYMKGKAFSEESIASYFKDSYTFIEPTFVHGGDKFGINPPRVASFYGKFIEGVLSSGPIRALTNVAPEGIIKIALEAPVSVESVASACVASSLEGASNIPAVLDTYDKIQAAAKMSI